LFAFSAVLKAGVELSANRPWQAGNFSDASHEFDLLFELFLFPALRRLMELTFTGGRIP
jgi:hypothetical protein